MAFQTQNKFALCFYESYVVEISKYMCFDEH